MAEGLGSLQTLTSEIDASLQAPVASNVDTVPIHVQSPATRPIRPTIAREARSYLTGDMERLTRVIFAIIEVESARCWMPVQRVVVGLKRSFEEDWIEIVFRVHVKGNSGQAFAFWDAIGSAIDRCRPTLAAGPQQLLDEQMAVFVEWE